MAAKENKVIAVAQECSAFDLQLLVSILLLPRFTNKLQSLVHPTQLAFIIIRGSSPSPVARHSVHPGFVLLPPILILLLVGFHRFIHSFLFGLIAI